MFTPWVLDRLRLSSRKYFSMNSTIPSKLPVLAVSVATDDRGAQRPSIEPLFPIGQLVATPALLRLLQRHQVAYETLLHRHVHGDWGDLDSQDRERNEAALLDGGRLLSAYALGTQDSAGFDTDTVPTVWIITEAGRGWTTLLLPDEY